MKFIKFSVTFILFHVILDSRRKFCDGVIVDSQWILMVTYNFYDVNLDSDIRSNADVKNSSDYNKQFQGFNKVQIKRLFIHKFTYDPTGESYDITLLKLQESPLEYALNLQSLPTKIDETEGSRKIIKRRKIDRNWTTQPKHLMSANNLARSQVSGRRILGGRNTEESEYPYQVSIQVFKSASPFGKFCGGVIIHPRWILTAAHCEEIPLNWNEDIRINAGVTDAFDYGGHSQAIKVIKAFVHPKFNPPGVNYDIALLKLQEPLKYGPNVKPISLPPKNYVAQGVGNIIGWGQIDQDEVISSKGLMVAVDVPVSKDKECTKIWGNIYDKENMICVGANFHKNACRGDSGGPFIQFLDNRAPVVVGIASFGADKCDERPMVYTKVARFLNFINNTIERETDDY